jgi:hypothetical protein
VLASRDTVFEPPALGPVLARLDHALGPPGSLLALGRCLALALAYGWLFFFLGWGLGGSGTLGDLVLLADPPQPARAVGALSAILAPALAILIGRGLGRLERRATLAAVRRLRRRAGQRRHRLRLADFERRYRWLLGLVFGVALVLVLIAWRRADLAVFLILFSWLALGPVAGLRAAGLRATSGARLRGLRGMVGLVAGAGALTMAVATIAAFALSGVATFAFTVLGVTNIALTGAVGLLLDMVMGGALTLGIAVAGAGVAAVALALAGAGTGIATLTGVATLSRAGLAACLVVAGGAALALLTFGQSAIAAGAIGGIATFGIAAAIAGSGRQREGAFAGAGGALALLTLGAIGLGWAGHQLVLFVVVFFFLAPFANGVIDWLAFWASAGLGGGSGVLLALKLLCGLVAPAALIPALAFALGWLMESYNGIALAWSGDPALDLRPMIQAAAGDPFGEGLWLTAMLLTPLLPSFLKAVLLFAAGLGLLAPEKQAWQQVIILAAAAMLVLLPAGLIGGWITTSPALDLAPGLAAAAEAGIDVAARLAPAESP